MVILKSLLGLVLLITVAGYFINASIVAKQPTKKPLSNTHNEQGKFRNTHKLESPSLVKTVGIWLRFFTEKKVDTVPNNGIPVQPLSYETLKELSNDSVHLIKLGHSTSLLKVMGEYWLIDPVFSERASPFSFAGPKRFHQPPISLEALPNIDKVLISHNHYDHLDKNTIKQLASKTKHFYVPLGVEADIENWGVNAENIHSFDWWDEMQTDHAMIAFTPTQHFSGRGIGDENLTLWGAWVIKTAQESLYFSGDSGYFDGFKKTGDKYGPFDLTLIETGAYDKDWSDIHMTPEESIQAHINLQGKAMIPIHNGTFDLAFHSWYEPLDRVADEAKRLGVHLSTPIFGEVVSISNTPIKSRWWH
ncbi:MBL fold metallo-hydrolase [Marinomonas sp.]|nr:MBL fold metallo-hydrolase [Marinomonas sp.]MDB4837033.1 MBL fold metallo-hydrolase [Marinomonas sp.]